MSADHLRTGIESSRSRGYSRGDEHGPAGPAGDVPDRPRTRSPRVVPHREGSGVSAAPHARRRRSGSDMRPATAVGRRVNLLGRPNVEARRPGYSMRSRKSWALLAYLLMCERAPTRRELASLLFER